MKGHISKKRAFAFLLSLLLTVQKTLPAGCLEAIAQSVVGEGIDSELIAVQDESALDPQVSDDQAAQLDGSAAEKPESPAADLEVSKEAPSQAEGDLKQEAPQPGVEAASQPAKAAARAADTTVGSMVISGGVAGTDYTVSGATVVVNTSTPLTFKGTLTNGTVQIKQGASANITLAGVTITSNTNSSPINLMGSGTTLKLFLADGTANNLTANLGQYCAGIHCCLLYTSDAADD